MSVDQERERRRRRVREAAARVEVMRGKYEDAMGRAIEERDRILVECHGERSAGFLSYEELRTEAGISKGRVIQVVQRRRKAQAVCPECDEVFDTADAYEDHWATSHGRAS